MTSSENTPTNPGLRKRVIAAIVVAIVGGLTFGITAHLANTGESDFLVENRTRVFAAEIAFFGILLVELLATVTVVAFHKAGALETGLATRAFVRLMAYLILLVSIVSILAQNPALAIGVGGITGVIVAFSAQNLVANAFAGTFLTFNRPFKVGEQVTIGGFTGTVTDIRMMYTRIDLGDEIALVPSNWIMSQVIRRKPRSQVPWTRQRKDETRIGGDDGIE